MFSFIRFYCSQKPAHSPSIESTVSGLFLVFIVAVSFAVSFVSMPFCTGNAGLLIDVADDGVGIGAPVARRMRHGACRGADPSARFVRYNYNC